MMTRKEALDYGAVFNKDNKKGNLDIFESFAPLFTITTQAEADAYIRAYNKNILAAVKGNASIAEALKDITVLEEKSKLALQVFIYTDYSLIAKEELLYNLFDLSYAQRGDAMLLAAKFVSDLKSGEYQRYIDGRRAQEDINKI